MSLARQPFPRPKFLVTAFKRKPLLFLPKNSAFYWEKQTCPVEDLSSAFFFFPPQAYTRGSLLPSFPEHRCRSSPFVIPLRSGLPSLRLFFFCGKPEPFPVEGGKDLADSFTAGFPSDFLESNCRTFPPSGLQISLFLSATNLPPVKVLSSPRRERVRRSSFFFSRLKLPFFQNPNPPRQL